MLTLQLEIGLGCILKFHLCILGSFFSFLNIVRALNTEVARTSWSGGGWGSGLGPLESFTPDPSGSFFKACFPSHPPFHLLIPTEKGEGFGAGLLQN